MEIWKLSHPESGDVAIVRHVSAPKAMAYLGWEHAVAELVSANGEPKIVLRTDSGEPVYDPDEHIAALNDPTPAPIEWGEPEFVDTTKKAAKRKRKKAG